MSDEKRPTQEELDEAIRKAEELDETPEENPEDTPEEEEPDEVDDTEDIDDLEEEPDEEADDEEESEPKKGSEDYKKKFAESSKENQKIYAHNRKINEAIEQASDIAEPTDEEMDKMYDGWDVMSDFEKQMAKDNFINKKRFELIRQASEEGKKIQKWHQSVEEFVTNPETLTKTPELEGKEDDFKIFANDTKNQNVPFDILVGAFLHNQSMTSQPKQKGKMFEQGKSGPRPKKKSGKITMQQAQQLMKTDYKKYKQYLMAGKIDTSTIK